MSDTGNILLTLADKRKALIIEMEAHGLPLYKSTNGWKSPHSVRLAHDWKQKLKKMLAQGSVKVLGCPTFSVIVCTL